MTSSSSPPSSSSSPSMEPSTAAAAAEKEEVQIFSSSSSSSSSLTPPIILSTPPISSSSSDSSSNIALGFEKAICLHGHFYFNAYNEEEKEKLNAMWLNPIVQIGEVVAGDEKLYHYTAHHMNTRAVPQKKDVSISFF